MQLPSWRQTGRSIPAPSFTGTLAEGQTLTADPGSWAGTSPFTYTYYWLTVDPTTGFWDSEVRTGETFTLTSAQIGKQIQLWVTATNAAGDGFALSAVSELITASPPVNTEVPAISGTAQEGHELSASPGTWAGAVTPPYAYQ